MSRILPSVILCIGLALIGCGDGDGDGGDDGGTADAGPPSTDQCVNANDTPIVDALYADGGSGLDVGDYVIDCAADPISGPCYPLLFDESTTDQEIATCLADCTSTTDVAGLSDGCLLCFAEVARCGANNCALECLTSAGACNQCLVDSGCFGALQDCTGLATP